MTTISPQMTPPMTLAGFAPRWRKLNGLAVLSLTLGVLQFLLPFVPTALVTIPVGVNALRQTESAGPAGRQGGRNLAIAGLALSVAHSVLYVVLFVWLIVAH